MTRPRWEFGYFVLATAVPDPTIAVVAVADSVALWPLALPFLILLLLGSCPHLVISCVPTSACPRLTMRLALVLIPVAVSVGLW